MEIQDKKKQKRKNHDHVINEDDILLGEDMTIEVLKLGKTRKKVKQDKQISESSYEYIALHVALGIHIHNCKTGKNLIFNEITIMKLSVVNRELNQLIKDFKAFGTYRIYPRTFGHPFLPSIWKAPYFDDESLLERSKRSYIDLIKDDTLGKDIDLWGLIQWSQEWNLPAKKLTRLNINRTITLYSPIEETESLEYYIFLICKSWNTQAYHNLLFPNPKVKEKFPSKESESKKANYLIFSCCLSMGIYLAVKFELDSNKGRKTINVHWETCMKLMRHAYGFIPKKEETTRLYYLTTSPLLPLLLTIAKMKDVGFIQMAFECYKKLTFLCALSLRFDHSVFKIDQADKMQQTRISIPIKNKQLVIMNSTNKQILSIKHPKRLIHFLDHNYDERNYVDSDDSSEDIKDVKEIIDSITFITIEQTILDKLQGSLSCSNDLYYFWISFLQNPDYSQELQSEITKIIKKPNFKIESAKYMTSYILVGFYSSPNLWTLDNVKEIQDFYSINPEHEIVLLSYKDERILSFMNCDGNLSSKETWRRICLFRLKQTNNLEKVIEECKENIIFQGCINHCQYNRHVKLIQDYLLWYSWIRIHRKEVKPYDLWNLWLLPACKTPIEVPDYFWLNCYTDDSTKNLQKSSSSFFKFYCKDANAFEKVFTKEESCLLQRLVLPFSSLNSKHIMDHVTLCQIWLKNLEEKYTESLFRIVIEDLNYYGAFRLLNHLEPMSLSVKHALLSFFKFVQVTNFGRVMIDTQTIHVHHEHTQPSCSYCSLESKNLTIKQINSVAVMIYFCSRQRYEMPILEEFEIDYWEKIVDEKSLIFLFYICRPYFGKFWTIYGDRFLPPTILVSMVKKYPISQNEWIELLYHCYHESSKEGINAIHNRTLKRLLPEFDHMLYLSVLSSTKQKQIQSKQLNLLFNFVQSFSSLENYLHQELLCSGFYNIDDLYSILSYAIEYSNPTNYFGFKLLKFLSLHNVENPKIEKRSNFLIQSFRHRAMTKLKRFSHLPEFKQNKARYYKNAIKKIKPKPTIQTTYDPNYVFFD